MLVSFKTDVTHWGAGPNWRLPEYGPGGIVLDEGCRDYEITLRGDIVTLEADEAAKMLRKHGGEVVSEPAPQNCLDAIAAYDAEQAARYPKYTPKSDDLADGARGAWPRVTVSGERDGGRPW